MSEKLGPYEVRRADRLRLEREQYGPIGDRAANRLARSYSRLVVRAGQSTRPPLKPLYELLARFYGTIEKWRRKEIDGSVLKVMMRQSTVAIDRRSTQYLVLMRATLPGLEAKKCSKWAAALDAADYHNVHPDDLPDFLQESGGIEGAARERARLWTTVEEGSWAERSVLKRFFPRQRAPRLRGRR